MKTVELYYWVDFGKCDSSDKIGWSVELTDEEEKIYDHAIANELPLNEIPELEDALDRAYAEIEKEEISNAISYGEEYALECQGLVPIDCDELEELVTKRDPYALACLGLENATEEELNNWSWEDLDDDKYPLVKDIIKDFEPESPYDYGWGLGVKFVDPNEE